MDCSCGGIQKQLCDCKTWSSVYHSDPNDTNIVFMPKRYALVNHEDTTFTNFLHNLFNVCLRYNVRYCRLHKSPRKDKAIKKAVTDLIILLCFLLTNSIVFFTLLTRTTFHIGYILLHIVTWLKRLICKCQPYAAENSIANTGSQESYSYTVQ